MKDFIFGRGLKKFAQNNTPTIVDVMKNYVYEKENIKRNDNEARNNVCNKILEHWKKKFPSLVQRKLLHHDISKRRFKVFGTSDRNCKKVKVEKR